MNLLLAQNLANELILEHKLKNWTFRYDHARRRFGSCNFSKKEITLSKILTELNSPPAVRQTLIHEIAHALAGPRAAHGEKWKTIVLKLGGEPARCYSHTEIQLPPAKYTARCPHCEKKFPALRRKQKVACRSCCKEFNRGRYSAKFLLEFVEAW